LRAIEGVVLRQRHGDGRDLRPLVHVRRCGRRTGAGRRRLPARQRSGDREQLLARQVRRYSWAFQEVRRSRLTHRRWRWVAAPGRVGQARGVELRQRIAGRRSVGRGSCLRDGLVGVVRRQPVTYGRQPRV
jgi:hypothetical protein